MGHPDAGKLNPSAERAVPPIAYRLSPFFSENGPGQAAVDAQGGSGNVASRVRGKKKCDRGEFIGQAEATDRDGAAHFTEDIIGASSRGDGAGPGQML